MTLSVRAVWTRALELFEALAWFLMISQPVIRPGHWHRFKAGIGRKGSLKRRGQMINGPDGFLTFLRAWRLKPHAGR